MSLLAKKFLSFTGVACNNIAGGATHQLTTLSTRPNILPGFWPEQLGRGVGPGA